jgi:hypothetical protein
VKWPLKTQKKKGVITPDALDSRRYIWRVVLVECEDDCGTMMLVVCGPLLGGSLPFQAFVAGKSSSA